jgi:hypothetical protein
MEEAEGRRGSNSVSGLIALRHMMGASNAKGKNDPLWQEGIGRPQDHVGLLRVTTDDRCCWRRCCI